jgi:hypothetical protein
MRTVTAFTCLVLAGYAAAGPASAATGAVVRCQTADGRTLYSNQDCPSGSRLVKSVTPPTPVARAAAGDTRKRVLNEADVARLLELRRRERAARSGVSQAAFPALRQRQADAMQRAADCGYLQGEIDATRRMRDMLRSQSLETRSHFAHEDAESIRHVIERLAEDYRLLCSP